MKNMNENAGDPLGLPPESLATIFQIADYNRKAKMLFEDLILNPRRPGRMPDLSPDESYEMAREHAHFGEDE